MEDDTWFSLVYGQGMYNIDMVRWSQESSDDVVVDDLWSTGYREPGTDDSNDYMMGTNEDGESYYQRDLDTGDDEDFVLECGNVYDF